MSKTNDVKATEQIIINIQESVDLQAVALNSLNWPNTSAKVEQHTQVKVQILDLLENRLIYLKEYNWKVLESDQESLAAFAEINESLEPVLSKIESLEKDILDRDSRIEELEKKIQNQTIARGIKLMLMSILKIAEYSDLLLPVDLSGILEPINNFFTRLLNKV